MTLASKPSALWRLDYINCEYSFSSHGKKKGLEGPSNVFQQQNTYCIFRMETLAALEIFFSFQWSTSRSPFVDDRLCLVMTWRFPDFPRTAADSCNFNFHYQRYFINKPKPKSKDELVFISVSSSQMWSLNSLQDIQRQETGRHPNNISPINQSWGLLDSEQVINYVTDRLKLNFFLCTLAKWITFLKICILPCV